MCATNLFPVVTRRAKNHSYMQKLQTAGRQGLHIGVIEKIYGEVYNNHNTTYRFSSVWAEFWIVACIQWWIYGRTWSLLRLFRFFAYNLISDFFYYICDFWAVDSCRLVISVHDLTFKKIMDLFYIKANWPVTSHRGNNLIHGTHFCTRPEQQKFYITSQAYNYK